MGLKSIVRQLTPPVLWDLARTTLRSRRKYHSLDDLDRKIEKYLNYDRGYFVELGANNGVLLSNTLYFETCRNWVGVLIEPIPQNYLACRSNRSPRTRVFCNACTSFDYTEKFVEIIYSNLMSTPVGLETDISNPMEHAELGREFLAPTDDNFVFGAVARPLNDILVEARAPAIIDLLSLDVEGAELEVLKGVDHDRFRFKYVLVESRNLEKLSLYLKGVEYRLLEQLSHHDYLFSDMRGS